MKKILLTKRFDDVHACIEGHPEIWGCGKSQYEAIGNLVFSHGEEFELEMEWDKTDTLTKRHIKATTK